MLDSGKLALLKSDLRAGNTEGLTAFLGVEAAAADLIIIREQKLLLITAELKKQEKVAQAYALAASRVLSEEDAARARNYAEFTTLCAHIFRKLRNEIAGQMSHLKRLGKNDVLALAERVLVEHARGMENSRSAALHRHAQGKPGEQSEMSEYLLHEFNGLNNEVHWAVLRTINEVMKVAADVARERLTKRERENATNEFLGVVFRASVWNGWQYLLDKVTYGEWNVAKLSCSEIPEIQFEIADVKLERAKLIGIRRRLSETMRKMAVGPKEVKPLEDFGVRSAMEFVAYYLRRPIADVNLNALDTDFRRHFKILMSHFGKIDDLILGASSGDFDILGEYFVAILLRAWVVGRRKAASLSHKRQRQRIRDSALPLTFCKEIAAANGWPVDSFEHVLQLHVTNVPAGNYYDLMRQPFLQLGSDINSFGHAFFDDWPAPIRSRLLKGGVTSDRYGKLWEEYCAKILSDFGWLILGRNVKIRSGGRIVTDIDVLALRKGLLLLIQFKAMGIGAATVYEHWLARSKILRGVQQAKLAADELKPENKLLQGLLSSKGVKEWPTRVQPLIVTTSDIFTGWNPENVPVASVGSVVSILNGANVKHTTGAGEIVSTDKFIKGEEADPEEFLGFLVTPLDWRIADEAEKVEFRIAKTELGTFWLPELMRRKRPRAKIEFCGISVEG